MNIINYTPPQHLLRIITLVLVFTVSSSLFAGWTDERITISIAPTHDVQTVAFYDTTGPSFLRKTEAFLSPAKTFNKKRFWMSAGAATTLYAGASIALWEAWYKGFELGKFRTFNDTGEWLGMDKLGHSLTAYHYARAAYRGLNWSATPRKKALVLSAATSVVLQSTVEVMDGFSVKWGFSWADMAHNLAGTGVFIGQELLWQEQRINFKVSSFRRPHSSAPISDVNDSGGVSSLANRAADLYGTSPWERFIKDYNGQTLWLSANPNILLGRPAKLPWLNISFGYSPENLYGGFSNVWTEGPYTFDATTLAPRYGQYILSFDVDFDRLHTKSPLVKTLFYLLNHIKVPAPALSYGSDPGLSMHWLYF